MGIRCADHVTPLYPQKLALTSPTGGGRSVGIVRWRTKATEVFFRAYRLLHVPPVLTFKYSTFFFHLHLLYVTLAKRRSFRYTTLNDRFL